MDNARSRTLGDRIGAGSTQDASVWTLDMYTKADLYRAREVKRASLCGATTTAIATVVAVAPQIASAVFY